jgi:murein tripeptide amidase MpaA
MTKRIILVALAAVSLSAMNGAENRNAAAAPRVTFNTSFESGSLGVIEQLGDNEYRLNVRGQQDAYGRNRQATWFYFRMDEVANRALTLRLSSFRGEYNLRPSTPAGPWMRPVYSVDGKTWKHFERAAWDADKAELALQLQVPENTVWLAHIPPYPYSRVGELLDEVQRLPVARVEVIGHSVLGRELHLVTVTNFDQPDDSKKVVWLQARQHAWECGTSFLVEGALRFITSSDPVAVKLRDETIFKFVPMINPDSVARGEVRFNVNGFDPNRQWDEVDLRSKQWLERNPEIWYVKKALLAQHARKPVELALNLHNTEMNEYLETMVDVEPLQGMMHRFFDRLVATTTFDPSRPKLTIFSSGPANSTNSIWREAKVPMMLMEQRIGPSERKLGRIATTEDRLEFGRQLIQIMGEIVR